MPLRRNATDRLWAPWRSKYIYMRAPKGCIFCGNRAGDRSKRRILARTRHSFSMLNLYPYNNGHVMAAPFRHVKTITALTDAELLDLMVLVRRTQGIIAKRLHPHGFNIGMNIGRVAGAGFAGHVHVHIVPRWNGDTNFMPVVAGFKVVSESLDAMYALLRDP